MRFLVRRTSENAVKAKFAEFFFHAVNRLLVVAGGTFEPA
jgi:hypothetical protein